MSETTPLEQTPAGWDAVADAYEAGVERYSRRFAKRLLDLAAVGLGDHVLDVAAGPGAVSLVAARRGARVTAVDFSPGMVGRLRQRAADARLEIRAAVMDGQNLNLPDDTFDVAVSNFGVIFYPRPDAGLAELVRVVRPGGRVAVSVWSTPDRLGFARAIREAVAGVLPEVPDRPPSLRALAQAGGLAAAMTAAGLRRVEVLTVEESWDMPSAAWFRQALPGLSPASRAMIDAVPAGARGDVLDAIGAIVDRDYGPGPIAIPNEAHLGLGRVH